MGVGRKGVAGAAGGVGFALVEFLGAVSRSGVEVVAETVGLERALHGIEVMTAILRSGEIGAFVEMRTTCTRPEPLDPEAARALLA